MIDGWNLTQQHNPQLVKLSTCFVVRQIETEKYCGCEVKYPEIFVRLFFFFCTSFPWISCQNSKDWIMCQGNQDLKIFFIRSITTEIFKNSKWRLGNMPKIQGVKLKRSRFTLVPKITISTWCFAAPRWNLRGKQPECKTRLHWLRGSRDLIRGTALSVRNAWERIWKRSCWGVVGCL